MQFRLEHHQINNTKIEEEGIISNKVAMSSAPGCAQDLDKMKKSTHVFPFRAFFVAGIKNYFNYWKNTKL